MTKLILGCSYTDRDQAIWHDTMFDEPYTVFAKGGVDNAWITRTGLHVLPDYDSVFVMFTGLNRISVPLPQDQHPANYYFSFPIGYDMGPYGDVNLVQSGGPLGAIDKLTGPVKDIFKTVYTSDCTKYFSQLNMYHVIMFIEYLNSKQIPYKYTFIYDITKVYSEQSLGQCTDYLDRLDRTHYVPITPYEFAIENNGFSDDGFHLNHNCQSSWAEEVKKYL